MIRIEPDGADLLAWEAFVLAFTALIPLINPIGSALVFVGMVGERPVTVYKQLARKIAISTFSFLLAIEFVGSLFLRFFGISLPIVQITGGLIIAATAWALLFEKDSGAHLRNKQREIGDCVRQDNEDLNAKVFYPFTFPITAGPGTLVIMITLSAHASHSKLANSVSTHSGIAFAALALSVSVYFCYGYAPKLIKSVSPSIVNGILRVTAFILMCIGVQIGWNGLTLLNANPMIHK
jgi:multiple antibiotic resistance protein